MTWVTGLTAEGGKYLAEGITKDGEITLHDISELGTFGIPDSETTSTKRVHTTDTFETWSALEDPSEYLAAFGVELPPGIESHHQIYQFDEGRTRYVVPALALMRAFFRPLKYLLPEMFKPQALDRTGFLMFSTPSPTFVIDAYWASPGFRCATPSVERALTWMATAPSALRMANSVHQNALKGRIALVLPSATSNFTVRGKKIGNTFYVSSLNISRIFITESSNQGSTSSLSEFSYIENGAVTASKRDIPCGSDGQLSLSDSEWMIIEPVLLRQTRMNKVVLSQRDIFNDVIKKLATGVSWHRMAYRTGTWVNASRAFQVWRKSGCFDDALAILHELRDAPPLPRSTSHPLSSW